MCELAERGPVVLAFFAEPVARCDDQIDVLDRLRSALPGRPVRRRRHPRRPRRAAPPRARARLAAAGRPRPRRRRGQRLRGGDLPADHVRRARRRGAARRRSAARTRTELTEQIEDAGERRAGGPPRPRLARRRGRAPAGCGWRGRRSRPRPGRRRPSCASACAGWPTACTAPRRSPCAGARSRTPTACSSATSGSTPTSSARPVEAAVLRRMTEGGLRPQGLIADALTVAVLETGVGVQAFDAAALVGAPQIGESDGRLVIADEDGPLAVLFGEPEPRAAPTKDDAPGRARGGRRARRGRPVRRGGAVDGVGHPALRSSANVNGGRVGRRGRPRRDFGASRGQRPGRDAYPRPWVSRISRGRSRRRAVPTGRGPIPQLPHPAAVDVRPRHGAAIQSACSRPRAA